MENPASENSYEEAKKKAKEFYRKIGQVWCPALNDFIIFNSAGLRHLIRKGERPRSRRDQVRRFFLLRSAVGILADPAAEIARISVLLDMRFWTIARKGNKQIISVVVRQTKSGKKHFFSIYDQKIAR